jgi:signal transduction histidine kinase
VRTATLLGGAAVFGNALMGWGAYASTRRVVLRELLSENLNVARHLATEMSAAEESLPLDPGTLEMLRAHWENAEPLFVGTLQVMGPDGTLLFDSHTPSGQTNIGDTPLAPEGGGSTTLRELARSGQEWSGVRQDPARGPEAAAFAPAPGLGALVGVLVPYRAITAEALSASFPWIVGLGAITLGTGPLSILLLQQAYSSARAETARAQQSLQRHAARLSLLQQVDRALLAARTPEEVAAAALQGIRAAIPVETALVESRSAAGEAQTLALVASETAQAPVGGPEPAPDEPLLHVPLRAGDHSVGVLHLRFRRDAELSPDDRVAIGEIADALAVALLQTRLNQTIAAQNAELETRVARRTAELQNAVQELDAFAHTVAHDLRAPLRALRGLADIVLRDEGDRLGADAKAHLGRIGQAAARLDDLVRDLLEYARIGRDSLPIEPTPLDPVVDEALRGLATRITSTSADVRVVGRPLPTVAGNHAILVLVLHHLLLNALTFVAPDTPPQVRVGAGQEGGRVRLWVEDNGIGIAPEHQARIFGMFERLHGHGLYGGEGVGLAIVRRSVEALGGRVTLRSRLGAGSCFRVELDAAPERT